MGRNSSPPSPSSSQSTIDFTLPPSPLTQINASVRLEDTEKVKLLKIQRTPNIGHVKYFLDQTHSLYNIPLGLLKLAKVGSRGLLKLETVPGFLKEPVGKMVSFPLSR